MRDYNDPEVQIQVLIEYMHVMICRRDWHGVSDAANDIRELEVEADGPRFLRRAEEHA
jgi:D-arabinose 1-dehydrogenase-like Zn-dependent alcohol dehydrogenase